MQDVVTWLVLAMVFIIFCLMIFWIIKGIIDVDNENALKQDFLDSKCSELGFTKSRALIINPMKIVHCVSLEGDFVKNYCAEKIGNKFYLKEC